MHPPMPGLLEGRDNADEARAIRNAQPPTLCPSRGNRQERFDKIPRRIWKQRGGHTRSRYLADEDQVSEVSLRDLMEKNSVPQ